MSAGSRTSDALGETPETSGTKIRSKTSRAIIGSVVALCTSVVTIAVTAAINQANTLQEQSIERRAGVYTDFLTNVTAFQVSIAHCEEPMHQGHKGDPAACDKARLDFTRAAGSAWAVDFASSNTDVRSAKNEIASKINAAYVNFESAYEQGGAPDESIFGSLDADLKRLKEEFSASASRELDGKRPYAADAPRAEPQSPWNRK